MAGWTKVNIAAPVRFSQTVTMDITEVPANSVQEETFDVNGLTVDMVPIVIKPTRDAGLFIQDWRVSATDTLAVAFRNDTGAPINPASQDLIVVIL